MSSVIRQLSRSELLDIARSWETKIDRDANKDHPSDRRWFTLLQSEAEYDVWFFGWDREQSTDFHNHGGSSGVLTVVKGAHQRISATAAPTKRTLVAQQASAFGSDAIHNVYNANQGPSLSVHAYSPPLTAMTYFETENGRLVERETVSVDGPEPDGDQLP